MTYTITRFEVEGAVIVRAELHTADDFSKLVKELFAYRDKHYPQPKEEPK